MMANTCDFRKIHSYNIFAIQSLKSLMFYFMRNEDHIPKYIIFKLEFLVA